ncbi:MAG: hypothetical protein AAGN82_15735 [Myxococcota bacterium]
MFALLAVLATAPACTVEAEANNDDDDGGGGAGGSAPVACTGDPECSLGELCLENVCSPAPAGWTIGLGDGSPSSVALTAVYAPETPMEATDAAFDPIVPNRLWVLLREFESDLVCQTSSNCPPEAARALEGRTAIIDNPATDQVSVQLITDPNAWHFMRRPTALAMTPAGVFATVHEARTGNFFGDDVDFIGPSLWSTDLNIYGIQPPGLNGSHLDMLHQTPFGMGIAWSGQGNLFYLFNGNVGAIDYVDFVEDHGPGEADHSDGRYRRFVEGQLARVPNVPSHLQMADERWLYIADTGNGRIVRLDTTTGVDEGNITPVYEPLAYQSMVQGAVLEEVVAPGVLSQPSGLAIQDGVLYVSDYATNRIVAFDLDGNEVRSLQVDPQLVENGITGLNFGPEGRMLFVEKDAGTVWRIEPR